jgi:hypothetical protein
VVADRQPDLDNASVGILLHMFLSFVQTAAHHMSGGLFDG